MNKSKNIFISNKKAALDFNFEYKIEAGIVFFSDEVRSIRVSQPSLQPVFVYVSKGELFLKHLHLSNAKDPERDKKILLHRNQIKKIIGFFAKKTYTVIPLEFYEKNGFFKVLLGAGQHLQKADKREAIKEKEMKKTVKDFRL